ncbi:hypothetical protein M426DRAFT_319954 [Hypoxylon sp. CI-4A]|nr:hypothetical protein M426DRAFT_319954 [Hypoxylon sp. CI-4A]
MPRVPKIYSPYGPRPKRSAQLVLIWMVILVVALFVTFYLTRREAGPSSYAGMRLADEARLGKEPAGADVAAAAAAAGDGGGEKLRRRMGMMVP